MIYAAFSFDVQRLKVCAAGAEGEPCVDFVPTILFYLPCFWNSENLIHVLTQKDAAL